MPGGALYGVIAFPLGMLIDLVNANWEAIARYVVNTITLTVLRVQIT